MKNNKKFFIITIDTEADNQWNNNHECSTNNSKFLPRFQELSEKYNYRPVWLITHEMANDDFFVKYFKEKQDKKLCEIGTHLHSWNNPPKYELNATTSERAYLIEYPIDVMEKKIKYLDDEITDKFKLKPISHRAGRWAINDDYLNLLIKYGYKIDCSVTPHINWEKSLGATGMPGSDYRNKNENSYIIYGKLLEVPVTVRKIRKYEKEATINIKKWLLEIKQFIFGKNKWIRPDSSFSISGIKKVIDICNKNNDYIMFMIHSSELMPDGSPNFITENEIEKLYANIEYIFKYVKKLGYEGITLREYYKYIEGEMISNEQ